MRQIFLMLSIVLLGLTWAIAQEPSGATSSRAGQSASSQTTVEGCLSGSDGNFTLTDKNGTTYQLTGDTAKLSEHVGHEVKITGMPSSGAASGEASAGSSKTLEVSSVKHVSKTCKSGGGMAH